MLENRLYHGRRGRIKLLELRGLGWYDGAMSVSFHDPDVLEYLVDQTGLRNAEPSVACHALADLAKQAGYAASVWRGEVPAHTSVYTDACGAARVTKTVVHIVAIGGQNFIPVLSMRPTQPFHSILAAMGQAEAAQQDRENTGPDYGWNAGNVERWKHPEVFYLANGTASARWSQMLAKRWNALQAGEVANIPPAPALLDPLKPYEGLECPTDDRLLALKAILEKQARAHRTDIGGRLVTLARDRQLPLRVLCRQVQVPHGQDVWVGKQHVVYIQGVGCLPGIRLGVEDSAWTGVEIHRHAPGSEAGLAFKDTLEPVEPIRISSMTLHEERMVACVQEILMRHRTPCSDLSLAPNARL